MSRGRRQHRQQDAIAVSSPTLAVPDEDREQIEDEIADLFIDAVFETFGGQTAYIAAALRKKKKSA